MILERREEQEHSEPINAQILFNVNVRVGDTVSLMDGNKYFPRRSCLLFNSSTPYCSNEERYILEGNDMNYKLSELVSIFNMTCSQFASVIYHGFRMLYGAIGKFIKGFQPVSRFIHINFVQ